MKLKNTIITVVATLLSTFSHGQSFSVQRMDPPSWRVRPSGETIEILLKGSGFEAIREVVSNNSKVKVISFELAENPHYLFLNVKLEPIPEDFEVRFQLVGESESIEVNWNVGPQHLHHHGISTADYLYLITADRFSNGNPFNDVFVDMEEDSIAREEPYARHGGDIQGIFNHLDYIQNLGVTGLWVSPLLENNEPQASYHGYAITDHYYTDPRNGSNQEYKALVDELHRRKMKIVMDVVYNHFGDQHYLFLDPPAKSWFNQWEEYTQTNYRATALMDPYASHFDQKKMSDGWFDRHMPDVNQRDPHMAKWLIQNSIWWIDEFNIDAFRIDTYAYPDQEFMAALDSTLLERFPDFFIFAETWVHHEPTQYWFMNENTDRPFPSHLQSVTDFQLYFALKEAMTTEPGWSSGLTKVYYVLAHDYLYDNPELLVTFADNHDEGRFYGLIGEDMRKFKMGLGLILTTRGIPCLYYGTEIAMKETDGHGKLRQDFPGGWDNDPIDKFQKQNLTPEESEAFEFTQSLGKLRTTQPAFTDGKLMQWAVKDGVYAYARYTENQTFLILMNGSEHSQSTHLANYDEILKGERRFQCHGSTDFSLGEKIELPEHISLNPHTIHILELTKE